MRIASTLYKEEQGLCRSFGQYACRILQTGHRKEVVEDMTATIKELLQLFERRNKVKPEAIIVYRDGVSMGEFTSVRCPFLGTVLGLGDLPLGTVLGLLNVILDSAVRRDRVGMASSLPCAAPFLGLPWDYWILYQIVLVSGQHPRHLQGQQD